MRQFPKGGVIGKAVHAAQTMHQKNIPLHAAYAAYFLILSIFPALLLVLSMLRYTGLTVEDLIWVIGDFFPQPLMETA